MSDKTEIQIAGVTINSKDGVLFNLNDLHKASGAPESKKPSTWMRNAQTKELIEFESSINNGETVKALRGGSHQGTYASKEVSIAYAMWLSPAFMYKVIQVFYAVASGNEMEALKIADTKQSRERFDYLMLVDTKIRALYNYDCSAQYLRIADELTKEQTDSQKRALERMKERLKERDNDVALAVIDAIRNAKKHKCQEYDDVVRLAERDKRVAFDTDAAAIIYHIELLADQGKITFDCNGMPVFMQ